MMRGYLQVKKVQRGIAIPCERKGWRTWGKCGDFTIGEVSKYDTTSRLSQIVAAFQGIDGCIYIEIAWLDIQSTSNRQIF